MSNIDQLFAGMADAKIFGKGSYFEAGIFKIKLKSFFVKDGFNGTSFISEFEVLESSNPAVAAGVTRSFVMLFTNKYIMADVSQLVMALLGFDPSKKENQENAELRQLVANFTTASLGSEKGKAACGEAFKEGMFLGRVLGLECTQVPTKPSVKNPQGGQFTNHKWIPLPETAAAAT